MYCTDWKLKGLGALSDVVSDSSLILLREVEGVFGKAALVGL